MYRLIATTLLISSLISCNWFKGAARKAKEVKNAPPKTEIGGGGEGARFENKIEMIELQSGGIRRTSFLHVPSNMRDGAPLVISLHGGLKESDVKGRLMARAWSSEFDKGIVFAFPNSSYSGSEKAWFGFMDGRDSMKDINFMRDLIDDIADRVAIDKSKVYLTGFSAGAGFTWYASCVDPQTYAGFATTSMMIEYTLQETCQPSVKRPMIHIHGARDKKVDPNGTPITGPIQLTEDWLVGNRRCTKQPRETPVIRGGGEVLARGKVFDCRTCGSVEMWIVEKGEHCWPTKNECGGVDADKLILDYWRREAGFPS